MAPNTFRAQLIVATVLLSSTVILNPPSALCIASDQSVTHPCGADMAQLEVHLSVATVTTASQEYPSVAGKLSAAEAGVAQTEKTAGGANRVVPCIGTYMEHEYNLAANPRRIMQAPATSG